MVSSRYRVGMAMSKSELRSEPIQNAHGTAVAVAEAKTIVAAAGPGGFFSQSIVPTRIEFENRDGGAVTVVRSPDLGSQIKTAIWTIAVLVIVFTRWRRRHEQRE